MSDILLSARTEGMVDASADYYQESRIFKAIQNAQALEYDRIEDKTADLALQLSPLTATWGLKFWEEGVGLPVQDNDDYEARRPAVLARWYVRNENFNTKMVKAVVRAYGKQCDVAVNFATSTVIITFLDGVPVLFTSLRRAIDNIIHAHLGKDYRVLMPYMQLQLYHSTITSIHGHIPMPARRYRTYDDIKDMTYEELRGKTYEQILYKE